MSDSSPTADILPPLVRSLVEFTFSRQHGPIDVPRHVHHFCQMDVILDGSMELLTEKEDLPLRPGDGTLIPPICRHGFQIQQSVRHASFKFHVHPRYAGLLGRRWRKVRFDNPHLSIVEAAGRLLKQPGQLSAHRALAVATLCLVHILQADPPTPSPNQSGPNEMWDVLSQVIAQPHNGWTVRRMAEQAAVSEGHFTRLFVKAFEQTPQRFLLEARMWDAANRLSDPDASIKSIAQATGYATVHSFTRAFTRAMGVSPAAYARSQGKL